jgi:threonine dehydratase
MITLDQIRAVRERIAPYIRTTPTVRSETLSREFGAEVFLKQELFQKTGSFKPRAAFPPMLSLGAEERRRGCVAVSGGNFAQAVAYAGHALGIDIKVLMPSFAPKKSIEATRGYGAQVELTNDIQTAFELAEDYRSRGWTFLHPFEGNEVVVGNATLGLELVEQVPDLTDVVVSVGGGALMAGVASGCSLARPDVRIWSVETEGADKLALSLQAGQIVKIQPTSLAKTLGAPYVSTLAFEIASNAKGRHIVVTDREAFQALNFLLERTKLVTELSAACTLAAARKLKAEFGRHTRLALILCGGNASLEDLIEYRARLNPPA